MRRTVALAVTMLLTVTTVVFTAAPALADGIISGTVFDELTGNGAPDVCVEAYTSVDSATIVTSTVTAADGTYTLASVVDDTYRLFVYETEAGACGTVATTEGWTSEWYDGAADHASATDIVITGDVTIDPELTGTASLDGTAFQQDGSTTLTCVTARLYDTDTGTQVDAATTAGDATYSITGVAPAYNYTLKFESDGAGDCADRSSEWLGGYWALMGDTETSFIDAADVLAVTAGATTTEDVDMELAGDINGTAVNEVTGLGTDSGTLRLYLNADDSGGSPVTDRVEIAFSDTDGNFTLPNLSTDSPGGYTIQVTTEVDYVGEWWEDQTSIGTADGVTFASENETLALPEVFDRHGPGAITGIVTDDVTGDPIESVTVEVFSSDGLTLIGSTSTDATGSYAIAELAPGVDYDVVLSAPLYNDSTFDNLTVAATVEDDTVGTDYTDTLIPADGSISGTVTDDSTTDPIEGATVGLYDDGGTTQLDSATTDAGGAFTIDGVEPGTYDLKFFADGYVTEWFDDQPSAAAGTITVGNGEAVTADAALLAAGGTISGTVTDDDTGEPVEGAVVKLYDNGGTTVLDEAETDADGHYSFDVAPGTYDLEFCHDDYIKEWFDNADSASGAVTVGDGGDVTADAGLATNVGTISGTITDASQGALQAANGVAGVTVDVVDDGGTVVASATTDSGGDYTIADVAPGSSYRVLANTGPAEAPVGFFQRWYIDSPLFLDEAATHISVGTSENVVGIDIALQPLFSDVVNPSTFYDNIVWLQQSGITAGCTLTEFCPSDGVTRAQMATFLVRALDLAETKTDYFTDDDGSVHEANINALREAEITLGCGTNLYCPNDTVTRAQMATFIVRALDLAATATDYFTDDNGTTHEANINALREAEITLGCGTNLYCPNDDVRRDQMAAFLNRALE